VFRKKKDDLIKWKQSNNRKPLIIKGARQVGKTWLMKEFARLEYQNMVYFNFDENSELDQLFQTTKDPKRLLDMLAIVSEQPILPQKTLIIFDEIQESADAINALKYFYEKTPDYHFIAAGSLLGVTLASNKGFPVGKVDFLNLQPLSFLEFLQALNEERLVSFIQQKKDLEKIPQLFVTLLEERLQQFYLIGGMPEVVDTWIRTKDILKIQEIQKNILETYRLDFSKHTTKSEQNKLTLVWESIPSQLIKENKKFIYRIIRKGARAKDYEFSLQWISNAGLIQKINWNAATGIPLKVYDDPNIFKTYLLDVGLLSAASGIEGTILLQSPKILTGFNGGLTENYICNALFNEWNTLPKYWTSDSPKAEIDFLFQYENILFPIEVKAATNIKSQSLKVFGEKKKAPLRLRFSLNNLTLNGNLLNLPLYLANDVRKYIDLAMSALYGENWREKSY
jgi:predicted AAA+ superfamily ATPase